MLALYYYLGGKEHPKTNALLEQLTELARKTSNPGLEAATLPMIGSAAMHRGEYAQARAHLERVFELHDAEKHQDHRFVFGQDTKVGGHVILSHILWYMGHPDQVGGARHRGHHPGPAAQPRRQPGPCLPVPGKPPLRATELGGSAEAV